MLRPAQISAQIEEIVSGHLSVDQFERWFRRESRNFHAYPDKRAQQAIFEVENILSEYHENFDEAAASKDLAAAIRPFVAPIVEAIPLSSVFAPGRDDDVKVVSLGTIEFVRASGRLVVDAEVRSTPANDLAPNIQRILPQREDQYPWRKAPFMPAAAQAQS